MKERQRDNNINKRLQFIGTAHTAPTRHRACELPARFRTRAVSLLQPSPDGPRATHKRQGDTPPDLGRAFPAAPVPADPPRAAVRTPYNRTVFNRQLSEQSPGCRRPQSSWHMAARHIYLLATWDDVGR